MIGTLAKYAERVYTDEVYAQGNIEVGVYREGRDRVIVFRGTDSLQDWLTNLKASKSSFPAGGSVHTGFLDGWRLVQDHVFSVAARCTGDIYLAGHSLGGALAVICALDLAYNGTMAKQVATFGAPRAGNQSFCDAYSASGLSAVTTRVTRQGDLVPLMPFAHWGFRHEDADWIHVLPDGTLNGKPGLFSQWVGTAKAWTVYRATNLFGKAASLEFHDMRGHREAVT